MTDQNTPSLKRLLHEALRRHVDFCFQALHFAQVLALGFGERQRRRRERWTWHSDPGGFGTPALLGGATKSWFPMKSNHLAQSVKRRHGLCSPKKWCTLYWYLLKSTRSTLAPC